CRGRFGGGERPGAEAVVVPPRVEQHAATPTDQAGRRGQRREIEGHQRYIRGTSDFVAAIAGRVAGGRLVVVGEPVGVLDHVELDGTRALRRRGGRRRRWGRVLL